MFQFLAAFLVVDLMNCSSQGRVGFQEFGLSTMRSCLLLEHCWDCPLPTAKHLKMVRRQRDRSRGV